MTIGLVRFIGLIRKEKLIQLGYDYKVLLKKIKDLATPTILILKYINPNPGRFLGYPVWLISD